MSLINEALKKAQAGEKNRTAPTSAASGSAPGSSGATRGHHGQLLILVVIICLVFSIGTALIVWGLTRADSARHPVVTTVDAPPPARDPQPAVTSTPAPDVPPAEPVVSVALHSTDVAAAGSDEVPAGTPAIEPVAEAVQLATALEPVAPPQPARSEDPEVMQFLNQIEVRGIMGDGRKILLFFRDTGRSQVFDLGATINTDLQLRITAVADQPHRITFEARGGFVHVKRF